MLFRSHAADADAVDLVTHDDVHTVVLTGAYDKDGTYDFSFRAPVPVEQFSLNLRADLHGKGVRVTSIEPGMGRLGEVIPVWYDPMDDGVEMKTPPDAAGVPAKPFHEFYEEALGRKPSGQLWDMYRRANLFTTTYLRVFMMPPKTPQTYVDAMVKAFTATAEDPEFVADTRQALQRTPGFKSGPVAAGSFRRMLEPNPEYRAFMADYIAKGHKSMGVK